MLAYTAEALKALDFGRPPPRAVCKTWFTLHLWRPAHQQQPVAPQQLGHASRRRSADRSMSIAWLNAQSLHNKTDAVQQTITERSIDVLVLSETWHTTSDDMCLRLSAPPGYAVTDATRKMGRSGGFAIVYCQHLKCSILPTPACWRSCVCTHVTTSGPVVIMNIYQPGSEKPSSLFFEKLTNVLEMLVVYSCPVVVGGDFNLRAQDDNNSDTRRFVNLLSSFDMVQHVHGPTHLR